MSYHAQHQLPPDATAASHLRYQVAHELAQLCPPSLGHEIVLTGSTSRGFSDDLSDIEQVFYVETLPPADERDQWLHGIHATNIIHDGEAIEDAQGRRGARIGQQQRVDPGADPGNRQVADGPVTSSRGGIDRDGLSVGVSDENGCV